ncbi:MAG: hypothetical protein M3O86_05490 [Actinomycetota bacterium]|nr:hypothetical protein [Actinomycetota bacterium]
MAGVATSSGRPLAALTVAVFALGAARLRRRRGALPAHRPAGAPSTVVVLLAVVGSSLLGCSPPFFGAAAITSGAAAIITPTPGSAQARRM